MAVGLTSSIESPYKRDDSINAAATVKHGEAVFTYGSPRSSAIARGRLETNSRALVPDRSPRGFPPPHVPGGSRSDPRKGGDVPVRPCACTCHSVDVHIHAVVGNRLKGNILLLYFG